VSVQSSRVKSRSRKERKPETYNVDSGKCGGVAISRRDDSQYGRTRVRKGVDTNNVKLLGVPRMQTAKIAGKTYGIK
jgi:hypothetical protein